MINKIESTKMLLKEFNLQNKVAIEVDGGITAQNVGLVSQAGAGIIIPGSSLFQDGEYKNNFEIYLIGLSVLVFLIFVFILIKKISSNGELKVKIEPVIDDIDNDVDMNAKSQQSFDFEAPVPDEESDNEELAILNLISVR